MEQHEIIYWEGKQLAATLHLPDSETRHHDREGKKVRHPLILICHGFVSCRVGVNRLFVKTAREFVADGYAVLRFDYAGCGESEGDYGMGGLDDLICQTQHMINYASKLEEIDPDRMILLGHSLGAAVALLTAVRDSRIQKLILWSAVAHPYKDIVQIVGLEAYRKLAIHLCVDHLGFGLTTKFFHSLSKFSPLKELQHYHGDVLLLHGTADADIPVEYCFHYYYAFRSRKRGTCEKDVIVGADHTFSSIQGLEKLLASTRQWLSWKMSIGDGQELLEFGM